MSAGGEVLFRVPAQIAQGAREGCGLDQKVPATTAGMQRGPGPSSTPGCLPNTNSIQPKTSATSSGVCRNRGLDILRVYTDEGKRSGLRLNGRDALKRLIDDVNRPGRDFDAILVYDVSRWGRFQDADERPITNTSAGGGVAVPILCEQFANDGSRSPPSSKG